MTRIEELKSMKGPQLIKEADRLGVKVKCDKTRKKLVEAKAALIDRILAFEAMPEMVDDEFTSEQLKEIDEAIDSMHEDDPESTETDVNENTQAESENATETNDDDQKPVSHPKLVPMPGADKLGELKKEYSQSTPKRGALIEWNGKSQNICAWAKELGISANTLYGRLYKLGWTVEKAFTTKGRK